MSYEGSLQRLCRIGHYSNVSVYDDGPEQCDCGAGFVWTNSVDETNGDHVGVIPEEDLGRMFGTGRSDEYGDIYRIPVGEEASPLRCYMEYDSKTGKFIYIPLMVGVVHGS